MKAVSPTEFAALMAALGPFEPAPRLAVAVSGGADSMAATLLAAHWAHERGGQVVALTVDHGLRPNSTAEAVLVGRWLGQQGIEHHILTWRGDKPQADIQAAARRARYGLIEDWCRQAGIVHVVLAHHQDDQAETFLLRLARGSGVEGLAAMPAIRHGPFLRWLRPFLGVAKARLLATVRHWDQDWVEDPSNQDPHYARARMRALTDTLAEEGLEPDRLARTAELLGRARDALERDLADAVVRWVSVHPSFGYARVAAAVWRHSADEVALRLLARLVRSLGGEELSPRLERTEGLLKRLRQGQGGTLGGCRVVVAGDHALFCREWGRMAAPVTAPPGAEVSWDGRFRALIPLSFPPDLRLGGLGEDGWHSLTRQLGRRVTAVVPTPVRPTLPALFDHDGVFAVPLLGYNRDHPPPPSSGWLRAAPRRPLTEIAHCLV